MRGPCMINGMADHLGCVLHAVRVSQRYESTRTPSRVHNKTGAFMMVSLTLTARRASDQKG